MYQSLRRVGMKKEFWLFARPIYYDKRMKRELSYYDYYRFEGEGELYFGFDSPYAKANRPCLVLKNLLADLFVGSKVYYEASSGARETVASVSRLVITCNPDAKSVTYFFPFFDKKKEYESRFRTKRASGMNPYANRLNRLIRQQPAEYIATVEGACRQLLLESCTVVDEKRLKDYLISRIEIFIDYVIEENKFSLLEKGNEELKSDAIKSIRRGIWSMSDDLPALLSRLLILAGLNFEKIDSLVLHILFIGGEGATDQQECDKFYILYCEENKTDFARLRNAYEHLCPESKYYKEIIADYAEALMHSSSKEKRRLAHRLLKELTARLESYGRAHYLLAVCVKDGIGCKADDVTAGRLFIKAAELSDGAALLYLAEEAFASPLPEKKNEAMNLCKKILALTPHVRRDQLGRAAFIIAEIYLSVHKDKVTAQDYYRIALDASYTSARHRLKQLSRPNIPSRSETDSEERADGSKKHLIVSGCEDVVESIRAKIRPSEWQMRLITEGNKEKTDMREITSEYLEGTYAEEIDKSDYPARSVFVFAESDEEVNLRNTLYLLDRLYNKYTDIIVSRDNDNLGKANHLIQSFDIYLTADYERASTMIDASLADMDEEVHFRVRICDTAKTLAEQLLYRAPLFIPSIRGEGNPSVVCFGSSNFVYSFIREAIASCFMINYPIKISAIDRNASVIENKIKQNCGGIFTKNVKRKIVPEFIEYDLSRPDLDDITSGREIDNEPTALKVKDRIAEGNYFLVDVGDDMENVLFAKNLRAWLLRSDPKFGRIPFIAVRCRDSVNAFWISRLHSGGGRQDPHWYNDYDFYIFGMMSDVYPSVITDNILEKIAMNIHLSYGGEDRNKEIAHFWQSTYRQDSSRATALGLIYRMFDGGAFLNNYRDYHNISLRQLESLAVEYEGILKREPKRIAHLAASEQARWNCFMLSRGWLPATPEQVRIYAEVFGRDSHKQDVAKLHPYICDWEDIGDGESSIPERIRRYIPTATSPKDITVRSIADTRSFFTESEPTVAREADL